MAVEQTLILAKPDAIRRSLGGEIVARFERRGFRLRAARLLTVDRALAEEHYAEHEAKPFFGELVDFITSGPTLAFVLEGEGVDRDGAHDDRRDESRRCRARFDPRRLRVRDAGQPRAWLRLARVGRARDRPLVPRRPCLSPITSRSTARRGRRRTPSTRTRAPTTRGRRRTSPGGWHALRRRGSACSPTSPARMSSSSAAAPRTSARGSRVAAPASSASTSRRRNSRRRGAWRPSSSSGSVSWRRTPRTRSSRPSRSTSSSPSTARRSGAIRTSGSRRPRGCFETAASSSSSATRRLRCSARPTRGRRPTTLQRPQRGLHKLEWTEPDHEIEFALGHGDWVRLLRANGFELIDLVELFADENTPDHTYYAFSREWSEQWPFEEIWRARLHRR